MQLTLSGPQPITIFGVQKDELVPQTAKSSSFATPQGYYCTDSGNLYLYIKGQEYKFSAYKEHTAVIHGEHDMSEKLGELEEKVKDLDAKVHTMHSLVFMPLHNAFAEHKE